MIMVMVVVPLIKRTMMVILLRMHLFLLMEML